MIRRLLVALIFCSLSGVALADPPAAPQDSSKRKLNFDDDVVEGMNKNPLDSLERVGLKDGMGKTHLYRKRLEFKKEINQTVREMGYTR